MKIARVQKGVAAAVFAAGVALTAFRPRPTDETLLQRIARQVAEYYTAARGEKAYLHLDRPVYATGETIWFSAYVVDASQHRLDSLSQVLHVDLVSPQHQVVARRTLQLRGGRATGDLDIADSLAAGTYVLRAYTNWMRNAGDQFIYSRRLSVWPASPLSPPDVPQGTPATGSKSKPLASASRPDVQFFPEGGYLVEGLPAVVACKATDASGRGLDVRGQILDAQNKVVVSAFSSRHGGMGRFPMVPGAGQRYHAHIALPNGSTADYPLPAVQASGYTLHVVENATDFLVEARYRGAAGAPAPGPVQLMTQVRGVVAYPGPRPVSAEAPATWRMPKKNYPTGIVHFTLFDAQGAPRCERLAFVQNGAPGLRISLTPDQASYGPHAPVQLSVRVTDAAGQPVAANFSVAVSDAALAGLDPNAETIASNLLLTSDLVGYVENPGYYFRNQSAATAQALDDLLLTQGWRRFVWKEVLAGQAPPVTFSPEQSISLTGQIVSANGNRPIPNSQLTFLQTRPEKNLTTATTDGQGRFSFVGIPVRDTAIITLQARRAQGGSNVLIKPDTGPPVGSDPLPQLPQLSAAPAGVAAFVRRSRQAQAAELDLHPEKAVRNINLGNVSVTAKREAVPRDDPRRLYGASGGTVVDFANDPSANSGINILQFLQGRVAGLVISGNGPDMSVQIRGSGTPQFILDGMKVDVDVITNLSVSDVEAVEVFKGAQAAIFGGNGGAIAVYTKRANPNYKGADRPPAPGIATVKLPGFYPAREFYQPRYNALLTNPPADPRTSTLYWNPTVRTNASGQAELHFFTADGGGTFQAVAEGLSQGGIPAQGSSGPMVVRGK
ncbi:TonB-dependent receptor plug domain-containing protein [Hymenobacter ruricola]|uniref:TonB-dependent receptor plug domain-containing protein n=1 Tax=Hymenobacter ruricola TaxID=2791023 RepID=A0ABS0I4F5_9BACT|nr:TonB-dependent receptor plug domain-containing protein [Hymenobacter ruricola]MBF9221813.1 TonB-dependent receptor plug domain-containing protein [Hymenobacter ruricola]